MRWDRNKLLEPNLHVYGKDDTKIMVYNVRRSPKRGDRKIPEKKILRARLIYCNDYYMGIGMSIIRDTLR